MPRPTDEEASRANDWKGLKRDNDNRGSNVTDGKDEAVPQGGKRKGPGHWEKKEDPSGD